MLVAPSTLPLMLYRLLKKVNQSFSTFLCSSDRSDQSGRHSSGLREDWPRAREASLPAKTAEGQSLLSFALAAASSSTGGVGKGRQGVGI